MKKKYEIGYRISINGTIEIEAESIDAAEEIFRGMSDEEIKSLSSYIWSSIDDYNTIEVEKQEQK